MTKYYQVPFGSSGTRAAVPNPTQLDGTVNYTDGYGADYSLPLDTDPAALAPERDKWNQLLYDITLNIQQYQQHGFPEFITTSDNGGSPFPYDAGAGCRNGGVNYINTLAANTNTPPGTGWVIFDGVNITGNAATATALQTARLIGGTSFDGTAAITPINITPASEAADTTCFVVFFNAASASAQQPKYNSGLTYNAATNALGATTFVGAVTGNASTATALATARNIGGVSFDGTADITPTNITPTSEASDTTCFIAFFNTASATAQQPKYNSALAYNSSTNALTATTFVGAVTGNASTATALQNARLIGGTSFDGTADITPTNITPASEAADTTCFVAFFNAASATAQQPKYNSGLGYNASTNALTATTFVGALTGNASTATALATPRNIGGVAFDGTAAIVPQTIASVDDTTDTTCFVAFFNASGTTSQQPKTNTSLTFNASTGAFGATSLGGTITTAAQPNITSVGTLTGGATGAGFTIALTTSTVTGTLNPDHGGTGLTTITTNALVKGAGTSAMVVTGVLIDSANGISGYGGTANTQSGTTYTITSASAGQVVEFTAGTAVAVTISKSLPAKFCCSWIQLGAGQLTFAAESGGTQQQRSGFTKSAGQFAMGTLYCDSNAGSAAKYTLAGDMA